MLVYTHTNENLRAIITGMEPTESDSILAIAGSGDQAFALLEYAGKVIAVDRSSDQINFVRQRIDALKMGHYRKFLEGPIGNSEDLLERSLRNRYFRDVPRTNERLKRIRKRLDRLEIVEGDIFQIIKEQKGRFNKLYLSNVDIEPFDELKLKCLPYECFIYFSSPPPISLERSYLHVCKTLPPQSRRTGMRWTPTIYRRVDPPIQVSPVAPLRAPVAYAP